MLIIDPLLLERGKGEKVSSFIKIMGVKVLDSTQNRSKQMN